MSYFSKPSAQRDAFLERVGRDLSTFGWELTDSADGALYTRPVEIDASERTYERASNRPLEREMLASSPARAWDPRHSAPSGPSHAARGTRVDGLTGLHRAMPDGMPGPSSSRRMSASLAGPPHGGSTVPRRSLPAVGSGPLPPALPALAVPPVASPGNRSSRPRTGGPRHSVPIAPKARDAARDMSGCL